MKMLKKVTAVLVVLLLVLGTVSIGATAVDSGTIGITIRADSEGKKLYPGDIVTFTVNISTNFNYVAMRWPVMYTLKAFEPVIGNDGNGDADYGNVIGHGTLADEDSYLESGEAITNEPFGGTYSKANYGCLLIQWTGGTSGNRVVCYNEPSGYDCLTFQLRVKPGFTGSVGTVAVPTTNQAKNMFYLEGITDPSNGNSTFHLTLSNLTFTSTPAQVEIIREEAGLQARGDTIIETVDVTPAALQDGVADSPTINYIYGLNSFVQTGEEYSAESIQQYLLVLGDAKIELWTVPELEHPETFDDDPESEKLISTGAKLKLYDANGTFLDEYTFVVFGDINGSGQIDGMDSSILINAFLYLYDWTYYGLKDNPTFFACDINGDGAVASDDYGPLLEAIGYKGYVNQTNDPTNFFVYY